MTDYTLPEGDGPSRADYFVFWFLFFLVIAAILALFYLLM